MADPTLRIAHVTDLHLDDFLAGDSDLDSRGQCLAILSDIRARGIGMVVLTGDLGEAASADWLAGRLEDAGLDFLAVPGNHDEPGLWPAGLSMPAAAGVPAYCRREDLGLDRFLYLDSRAGELPAEALAWLAAELAGGGPGRLFVFTHYPILDCGGSAMDRLYPLKGRERVRELLAAGGRETWIFCGHYHTAHEQAEARLRQAVTPSGLLQVRQRAQAIEREDGGFGYRIIDITPDRVGSRVVWL
jgi:Icc protein